MRAQASRTEGFDNPEMNKLSLAELKERGQEASFARTVGAACVFATGASLGFVAMTSPMFLPVLAAAAYGAFKSAYKCFASGHTAKNAVDAEIMRRADIGSTASASAPVPTPG